ncbi:cuticle protein 7-like [Penaeus japonicus]|uniref:cuticle protein 7-like n=1 Tax=Penaeus japonicus TaxID=27405 RepID=UPI001C712A18|nr:cuticle protein 7-like [Penaeus japonicus]
MFKVVSVALLMGVAIAAPRPDSPPIYAPIAPSYPAPHAPTPYKEEPPKPYQFDYGVRDDYSGASYGHNEVSDGNAVTGSYTVALPDGRIQKVTYVADHHNGFQADVTYEGEAVYPDHKPAPAAYPAPAPYVPAPAPYAPPAPYA